MTNYTGNDPYSNANAMFTVTNVSGWFAVSIGRKNLNFFVHFINTVRNSLIARILTPSLLEISLSSNVTFTE